MHLTPKQFFFVFIFCFQFSLYASETDSFWIQKINSNILITNSKTSQQVTVPYDLLSHHLRHAYQLKSWHYVNEFEEFKILQARNKYLKNIQQALDFRFKKQFKKIVDFVDIFYAFQKKSEFKSADMSYLLLMQKQLDSRHYFYYEIDIINSIIKNKLNEYLNSNQKNLVSIPTSIVYKVVQSYFSAPPDIEFVKLPITNEFEIQRTEITQDQWVQVLGTNPSFFSNNYNCKSHFKHLAGENICTDYPVDTISYEQLEDYINKLNFFDPFYEYSLPTQAQWKLANPSYDKAKINLTSWHYHNSGLQTRQVGTGDFNDFKIADMSGNISELLLMNTVEKIIMSQRGAAKMEVIGLSWFFNGKTPAVKKGSSVLTINTDYTCFDTGARLIRRKKYNSIASKLF